MFDGFNDLLYHITAMARVYYLLHGTLEGCCIEMGHRKVA